VHFPSLEAAVEPVPGLVAAGARAVELMVAPALVAAAHMMPGTPEHWKELPPESAALLVEFGGEDEAALDAGEAAAAEVLSEHGMLREPEFTREHEAIELAWGVREGLFGLMGRIRPLGTALIIEDVCVDPARIAQCAVQVRALLAEHGFLPGVAGHASAGNLHFQLTPDFSKPEDLQRYDAFMEALVALIVDEYDGSLKAEHGTGVNMAPFVEREWGPKATAMMWRVKELADPHGILNPGAILNREPGVHLRDLKTQPPIEEEAAHCVECGFCEPVCPSRNTTTTPRQRILLRRELARQPEGSPVYEALLRDFDYDAVQTCAADGTCVTSCPVAIDTGRLMKRFRARERTAREERAALAVARHFGLFERAARAGLRAGRAAAALAGDRAVAAVPELLRRHVSEDLVPTWPAAMPPPAPARLPKAPRPRAAAVYLPACVNRIFGPPRGAPAHPTLPEALVAVSARAGQPLWIPADVQGYCCATPWSSKGYRRGNDEMARRTADALWRWSVGAHLPVVIDATSCAHGLVQDVAEHLDDERRARFTQIEVLDSIDWVHDHLLEHLTVTRRVGTVAVHPTCSSGHLGLAPKLEAVARALADDVLVPAGTTCCGMAGDRGLLHPELPASALRDVVRELDGMELDACLCSNRTCEIALQEQTGRPYASFVLLLEELTRPPS
jgi:D-lactate dehydrogenase